MTRPSAAITGLVLLAAALLHAGCGPPATAGGFDAANPAARMYAIEQAGHERDRSAIPHLIEALDADDPAVRMLAAAALERITGRTFGYHFADGPAERRSAIRRWVRAAEFGELDRTSADAPPEG